MARSVWALASVTDQGERGTEGRENRNRETCFSTVTQTKLSHLQSMPVTVWQYWDSRAELLDHTLFEMSGWLIVLQWRELGLYTQSATLIYQHDSIFTCNLTDSGSFSNRLCYWFNRRLELFGIDLIDWKESNLVRCIGRADLWRFNKQLHLFQLTGL